MMDLQREVLLTKCRALVPQVEDKAPISPSLSPFEGLGRTNWPPAPMHVRIRKKMQRNVLHLTLHVHNIIVAHGCFVREEKWRKGSSW